MLGLHFVVGVRNARAEVWGRVVKMRVSDLHSEIVPVIATSTSWQHFAMVQMWLFISFLIYITVHELSVLSGRSFLALLFQSRAIR